MKCIHCNTDSTYPERQAKNGCCKQCLHAFAFDTRAHPEQKLSDGLFQRAIKDVSEDGKLWFTETQLYYELCRRLEKKQSAAGKIAGGVFGGFVGFGSIAASIAMASAVPLLIGLPAAIGLVVHSQRKRKSTALTPSLELAGFHATYVQRWIEVHGRPERLAHPPERPKRQQVYPKPQSELTSYSFDRVLVTETAAVAAMLVANNFHFENNCAILSLDGYPYDVRDTVMEMLGRNPNLRVFAIHDASFAGCEMAAKLRAPEWFPDHSVQITDLGLRPAHVTKARFFVREGRPGTVPAGSRSLLADDEVKWLEYGRVADLEQVRPTKLMRTIYQGFARANQALTSGSDGGYDPVVGPTMIWIHDPVADVHAADSFG